MPKSSRNHSPSRQHPDLPSTPIRPQTPVTMAQHEREKHEFRELLQGTTRLSDWTARYTRNAVTYAPTPTNYINTFASLENLTSSPFFLSPTNPFPPTPTIKTPLTAITPLALEEPWRQLHAAISGGPTSKFPYCFTLSRIESLPIPSFIDDVYLKDPEKPLALQLRTSLFDLESGMFFGRTWISSGEIDLRAGSYGDEENEEDDQGPGKKMMAGLGKQIAAENNWKGTEKTTSKKKRDTRGDNEEDEDESVDEETREVIKKRRQQQALAKQSKKSINKKIKRGATGLKVKTGKNESSEASSSSDTNGSGSDSDNEEDDDEDDDDDDDDDEEDSDEDDDSDEETSDASVEDTDDDSNDPDNFTPEYVSAGWTYFHLFDPDKNGIDLEKAWDAPDMYPMTMTELNTPIFHGSPRILLFVAPILMQFEVGYPALSPIPGSSFTFEFATRPDFRHLAHLWRENIFISEGSDIPGLIFSRSEIDAKPDSIAMVSKIRISVYPSLSKFEDALVMESALKHYQAYPESMTPDEHGNLPVPRIIERRIHIGLHNTQTFLSPPTITTLKPVYSEYVGGDGFEFVFNGNLELEKYVRREPGIAVVFIVEYKILLMTNDVSKKKSRLGAFVEKVLGEKREPEMSGLEKIVTVGWGAWQPSVFDGQNPQVIPLDTSVGPNPYFAITFAPTIEADEMELKPDWLEYAYKMGRLATDEFPIVLSFHFYDEDHQFAPSGKNSPVHDKIPEEEEEERAPTPKRPSTPPPLPKKHHRDSDDDSDKEDMTASHGIMTADPSQFPKPSRYRGRKGGALTRAERARLLSAGFPLPLDDSGNKPHPVSAAGEYGGIYVDMDVEGKDSFRNNEITFTLMGVSFTPELCMRLTGILYPIDEDGHVAYSPAGLSRTYLVENDIDACSTISSFSKTVPDVVQYLNSKSLHFDVWDGDSLLHLGAAVVELKPALRQGKSGIVYDDDVDIVFTEYINPSPLPRSTSHSSDISSVLSVTSSGHSEKTSRTTIIGKMHIRLVNIGRHGTEAGPGADSAALMMQQVSSKTKRRDPYSKENVIVRDHRFRVQLRPEIIVTPAKLVEIDAELAQMLSTAYEERVRNRKRGSPSRNRDDEEFLESVSERRRKLDRVKRIMQRSHQYESALTEATMPFYYNLTRQERQRDLDTIDVFRERRKPPLIEKRLAEQITVTHIINASFGQAHFFEYVFTNPYNEDHCFEIEWDDEELRLVTSSAEWKYLRRIHSIRVGVEDKLISVRPNGTSEIYMLANESVSIPFVFQSFLGGSISNAADDESSIMGARRLCGSESVPGGGIHPRKINVSFLSDKRMPVAMVDVVVKPRNYAIDRVLRFFRSEGELLRRSIKFYLNIPMGDGAGEVAKKDSGKKSHHSLVTENSTIHDAANPWKKYVRCSHSDVVCTLADGG
ncbi:Nephrocystin-4, partial [Rhizoclosmatium sp. JEL0117]